MSPDTGKTRRTTPARSKTGRFQSATARETSIPHPGWFFAVGLTFALAGIGVLVWLLAITFGGSSLASLQPAGDTRTNYASYPAVLFLFSGVALFLGEMFRRGRGLRQSKPGGVVSVEMRSIALWAHVAWLLIPVSVYIILVIVPVALESQSTALGRALRGVSPDFWFLTGFHGVAAAGVAGVILASLLKRLTFDRLAALSPTPSRRSRIFWATVSAQWQASTWLSFAGVCLLAGIPLLSHDALGSAHYDESALTILLWTGTVLTVLAVVTVLNSWRSGLNRGSAVGVSGTAEPLLG